MNKALCIAALTFALPSVAHALDTDHATSDTDDDVTLTLRVLEEITPDVEEWCEVNLIDVAADNPLSPGDQVRISIYEADIIDDDFLFSKTYTVGDEDTLDLTFDCSFDVSDWQEDFGYEFELYAEARVEKASCGQLCSEDEPETSDLDVYLVGRNSGGQDGGDDGGQDGGDDGGQDGGIGDEDMLDMEEGGCSVGGRGFGASLSLLLLVGLAGWRRRQADGGRRV